MTLPPSQVSDEEDPGSPVLTGPLAQLLPSMSTDSVQEGNPMADAVNKRKASRPDAAPAAKIPKTRQPRRMPWTNLENSCFPSIVAEVKARNGDKKSKGYIFSVYISVYVKGLPENPSRNKVLLSITNPMLFFFRRIFGER